MGPSARVSRIGLQLRIAATIACIVVVAVAALGVAVHLLVVTNRVSDARAAADERLHAAMDIYASTGLLSFDARVDDRSVPDALRASLAGNGSRATLVRGGGVREILAAGRVGTKVLSTRTSISAVDRTVRDVDRALLLAGLGTVLAATAVGAVSANRLARRLRVAARTARSVTGGGLPTSLRTAVGSRRDEVGDLADAVDTLTDRLASRLRAEQRFTADVAHDLRTPVTGLVTAAALLDDSRPAELVRDRAQVLHTLVEELLEVARLDRGAETADLEHVHLFEVISRVVRRGAEAGEYAEADVVLRGERDSGTTLTDPRRIERVLSNLVRNAFVHGAAPVEITQQGRRIIVQDHGPGFDAATLTSGPQPLHRRPGRTGGNGLGLVIASGQTAVLGGTLRLDNAPSGGARVTVDLPGDDGPTVTAGSRTDRRTGTGS